MREMLEQKKEEYKKEMQKMNNNIIAISGAIQAVDQIIAELDKEESANEVQRE